MESNLVLVHFKFVLLIRHLREKIEEALDPRLGMETGLWESGAVVSLDP